MAKTTQYEIIICTGCKGEGLMRVRIDFQSSETRTCMVCNGKGRLVKTTTVEIRQLED